MPSPYQKGPSWYLTWHEKREKRYKRVGRIKKYADVALKDLEVQLAKGLAGFPEAKKTETGLDLQNGHLRIRNIKTQRGYKDKYRWIPVHSALAEVLARRKAADLATPFQSQWGPNTLRVKLIALAKRAGIPKLTRLHDLGHTVASHLVQKGVSLYIVSKLLGHSSQETTRIYAHLSPETYEAAVVMLDL